MFIEKAEWQKLLDKLHQIKGTGGNFGFPDISLVAGKMEVLAKNKDISSLNKLSSELESIHQQIVLGLNKSF